MVSPTLFTYSFLVFLYHCVWSNLLMCRENEKCSLCDWVWLPSSWITSDTRARARAHHNKSHTNTHTHHNKSHTHKHAHTTQQITHTTTNHTHKHTHTTNHTHTNTCTQQITPQQITHTRTHTHNTTNHTPQQITHATTNHTRTHTHTHTHWLAGPDCLITVFTSLNCAVKQLTSSLFHLQFWRLYGVIYYQ